ncbi:hypothetical protein [Edaphobacter albus]|uniref:hypothetical protein n=1 Tax=Edaphobacter sp. 4G125 TaxID=2763071 RepID=UPI001647046C|nr:hypothetical protein [Edaphobacter sp. 4G125]QNI36567.1 hypothetical protein H7846_16685 [Edaphobacter sp. 4G125]
MFARRLRIERIDSAGAAHPCPIRWIDSFAMRNFTNDAIFDDTLPIADGLLEAGYRVPLDRLEAGMQDWFRRKNYIGPEERICVSEPA